MAPFSNNVVAITGAASRMGFEIAKLLVVQGAKLSLADIQAKALESAAAELRELGGLDAVVMTTVVDVRVREQVDSWIQKTVLELGGLHCAVNFAGVIDSTMGASHLDGQETDEGYNFVIEVNLRGVWNCLRAQLQHMKPGASIVNASSAAGLIGFAGGAAYTASKHGVSGLTRCTAKEYGPKNIRVNAVAPGYILTPMTEIAVEVMGLSVGDMGPVKACALGRPGSALEVAKLAVFLLSDDASYMTGTVIPIDGGLIC